MTNVLEVGLWPFFVLFFRMSYSWAFICFTFVGGVQLASLRPRIHTTSSALRQGMLVEARCLILAAAARGAVSPTRCCSHRTSRCLKLLWNVLDPCPPPRRRHACLFFWTTWCGSVIISRSESGASGASSNNSAPRNARAAGEEPLPAGEVSCRGGRHSL